MMFSRQVRRYVGAIVLGAVLMTGVSVAKAQASACSRAADAGWYHEGLNGLCALEILMDLFYNGVDIG